MKQTSQKTHGLVTKLPTCLCGNESNRKIRQHLERGVFLVPSLERFEKCLERIHVLVAVVSRVHVGVAAEGDPQMVRILDAQDVWSVRKQFFDSQMIPIRRPCHVSEQASDCVIVEICVCLSCFDVLGQKRWVDGRVELPRYREVVLWIPICESDPAQFPRCASVAAPLRRHGVESPNTLAPHLVLIGKCVSRPMPLHFLIERHERIRHEQIPSI